MQQTYSRFLSVFIHIFGNLETATETLLHEVTINEHNLTYVDKAGIKTPNAKTDMIISTNSMSQQVFFHLMQKLFPLNVTLYTALLHTIKIGIFMQ
jgi:hypothetical protein